VSITSEALPTWDVSVVAEAVREEVVDAQLSSLAARAQKIARSCRNKLAGLDQERFAALIGAYQDCVGDLQRLTSYAELAVASGIHEADGAKALGRCDVAWSQLSATLGFVESELAALDATVAGEHELLAPGGKLHNFYHRVVAAASSDDEIRDVLAAVRPSGIDGWQTLARQLLSRIRVVTSDGVTSVGSAMPNLYRADGRLRRQTQREITQALAGELDLRALALSMIVADGLTRAELTGTSWMDESLVSDQLSEAEVDALVAGASAGYPLVHRYFRVKALLLGETELDEADRYAPVDAGGAEISWNQAVETVLASFDAVHPKCGAAARTLLKSNRVDAAHRPGKSASPFTKDVPGELPWISVNFNGSLRHVLLLAHELGHGVHMMMASDLPLLAAATPRVLAETVALFFEAATLTHLGQLQTLSPAVATLTARGIEDQLVGACRQVAIYRFEGALRDQWRATGQLDSATIGHLWLDSQRELYGDELPLSHSFTNWWSCLDGIFQSPGSSYAYMYGQFAAAALVEQRAVLGADFGEGLLALMAAGGSAAPRDLLLLAGVDPLSSETWQRTLAALGQRVADLDEATAVTAAAARTFEGSPEPSKADEYVSGGR
jgi:oligoendopeptidase F